MNEFGVLGYWTENLEYTNWECGLFISSVPQADSRFAIAGTVPTSVTLSGLEPFSTQYGPPIMYIFSGTSGAPSLAATVTASSVNSGGASATFPLPSSLPQGGYFFVTENMASTGEYGFNSWNLYSIASSQTITGNPFGVSVGAMTDAYQGSNFVPLENAPIPGYWVGFAGSNYETFPVISLYSSNQVLINGTAVEVGPNPTAVTTYPSAAVTATINSSSMVRTDTYSGNTRAVVANSGSNTVSVLDIINDVVLFNVPVGNQPVALSVSSDGSTAYVANYTDSTVTQVNLNYGTATATIAVGGQPTSVALTAAGTLWVGGAGFLSQMNTQPMSVVATVPVSNKTIIALGFSDSVNQLVATSVDTGGNVYADEINPSTVQAGGTYSTLASHTVSSVGTYGTVQAYTATLASARRGNPININQVGAPPLVVQDGWAVVTATPTGFTITDITGQVVLVSETTPSPVTAIAVDSQLNVAYLTMPDSNTLLTVPLPGTNANTNASSPSFTVTAIPNGSTTLSLGHSMNYTINVSPVNGFTGPVALSASWLPAGVTASFSPASINTSGSATLTLTSAYSTSTFIGNSNVTITGTSGGLAIPDSFPITTQPLQYKGACGVQ
jgi:YVTN family beta-propeller protein